LGLKIWSRYSDRNKIMILFGNHGYGDTLKGEATR